MKKRTDRVKKERNGFMKRSLSVLLAGLLLLALCACGETAGEPSSPYLGLWSATSAQYDETEFDVGEVFSDGLVLELKENGICQLTVGEQSDPVTWSAGEDGSITISDGEADLTGTISEEEIVLEISGMYITLTREDSGADHGQEQDSSGQEAEKEETE